MKPRTKFQRTVAEAGRKLPPLTPAQIHIKVLDSVEAIRQEEEAMHHCVFANEYYLKPDSLILSATITGRRIETVEISLKQWQVVQSRGVCNRDTEYHDRIVRLVNRNIHLIRQRITA